MNRAWEPLQVIADHVRTGKADPVELAERALKRASEAAHLGAVTHLDPEGALRAARNPGDGPLAGVPVLVKEIIEVEGLPYTCGSNRFAGRVGERDAEVVRRLRAAGAVVIGLSYSHEFAYGCSGTVNRAGVCRNPRDPGRMSGGSSSGAASAVGAGIVPLAIGTDTAGSVRVPAALCGVVGVKPPFGALPVDGVFPLSQSLDHVGVLTATVADAAYAVAALGGGDARAAGAPRLAVPAGFDPLLGIEDTVELPDFDEVTRVLADVQGPEAAAIHAPIYAEELYQPDVRERLRLAREVPGWRYVAALARMREITQEVRQALAPYDAVVLPTVLIPPPPLEEDPSAVREPLLRNTRLASLTGLPAVSVPVTETGVQLVGVDYARVMAAAAWVENTVHTPL